MFFKFFVFLFFKDGNIKTFMNLVFLYHCRMFRHFKRFLTAQVMTLEGMGWFGGNWEAMSNKRRG